MIWKEAMAGLDADGSTGGFGRRRFLALASALAGGGLAGSAAAGKEQGFFLRDEEARRPVYRYLGGVFECKVSAADTGGEFCVFDTLRLERGGPGRHVHAHQDEWFYVVRGEFLFEIGEEQLRLGPGDSALGPRGVPHAFARVGEETGQLLIVFQPAQRIEELFEEAAAMIGHGGMPDNFVEQFSALVRKYDIEVVGPPLPVAGS